MARPRIVGLRFAAAAFVLAAATIPAAAQDISVTFGQGTGLTERVLQLVALVTVLSLAPSILVMVTSFTRIVVVLSLALFLTAFVMGPAFQGAYDQGIRPLIAGEIQTQQAFDRSSEPFREFMNKNVREQDLKLFLDLSHQKPPEHA